MENIEVEKAECEKVGKVRGRSKKELKKSEGGRCKEEKEV